MQLKVAGAAALRDGQTQSFQHGSVSGFLLRWQGEWRAFRNLCPHLDIDLDMGDERYYASDIDRIYCKNHGALFQPATGVCDQGPCVGRALERFAVHVAGGDVWVTLPDE